MKLKTPQEGAATLTSLVGVTVTRVRRMTEEEMADEGWGPSPYASPEARGEEAPTVIELSNGLTIYPSRDYEGNGPGALFGRRGDALLVLMPPPA